MTVSVTYNRHHFWFINDVMVPLRCNLMVCPIPYYYNHTCKPGGDHVITSVCVCVCVCVCAQSTDLQLVLS